MKFLTTRGYIFGHMCYWDEESQVMRYEDTNELASVWGGESRPCPKCGEMPTPEGYDPCIGYIPGANHACCGHGVEAGYIMWPEVQERELQEEPKASVSLSVLVELMKQAGLWEDGSS